MAHHLNQQLVVSFGKKRGKNGRKPGPPVHDDRCAVVDEHGRTRRVFAATQANELWLVDITEHKTAWIPAVVATPAARSGDAGEEVHGATEVGVPGADSIGCRNTSNAEVLDGTKTTGRGPGGPSEASVAGASEVSATGRGWVLEAHRAGAPR